MVEENSAKHILRIKSSINKLECFVRKFDKDTKMMYTMNVSK